MRRIFWGFCRNWLAMSPLDYLSSRSAFGFVFAEIFVIEKRLPDSPSRGVTRMPLDTIFFKPLNQSMVIVHNIPAFLFAKFVF
jgi:hypothetical protein